MDQKLYEFFSTGQVTASSANRPFCADDPSRMWLVLSGKVDVFFVPLSEGGLKSSRQYLFSADTGTIIVGMGGGEATGLTFMGVGNYGTEVASKTIDEVFEFVLSEGVGGVVAGALGMDCPAVSLAAVLEEWIQSVSAAVIDETSPNRYQPCRNDIPIEIKAGEVVRPVKGVHWLLVDSDFSLYGSASPEKESFAPGTLVPLCKHSWLVFKEDCTAYSFSTMEMIYRNSLRRGLFAFRDMALQTCLTTFIARVEAQNERLLARDRIDIDKTDASLRGILGLVEPALAQGIAAAKSKSTDPLLEACRLVGAKLDLEIVPPSMCKAVNSRLDPITRICLSSKIRSRDVILKDDWYTRDVGPLVAYIEAAQEGEEKKPIAIIPITDSTYEAINPADNMRVRVTKEVAETLHPVAHTFYTHLPHRDIGLLDLFKYGIKGKARDGILVFSLALFGGVFGMIMPMVTGTFFDTIIPSADRSQLLQYCLGLFAVGLGTGTFELTRSFAMMRISAKTECNMQSAVWDRLLNMPVNFFNKYTVGDLAMRANSVNSIYKMISGTTANTIVSSIFSVFNLLLLFYYNVKLAVLACFFVLVTLIVSTIQSYLQVKIQREGMELGGKTTSLTLQLILGIPKLRVAGAEHRAFSVWSEKYIEGKGLNIKARWISNHFAVFNSLFSVLPTLTIYYFVANYLSQEAAFTTGKFMAFNAAFGQFMGSTLKLGGVFISIMGVVPTYERIKPILDTQPEIDDGKADPGELSGEIEISHLTFRYNEDGPIILDDVNIRVNPGEFVAVVGPSGSGKSTLLRLLLGFEKSEAGVIYYDGKNSFDLDPHAVRQQFGVVLQNGKVIAGDIFSNIVGANRLSVEDAWEAARMAGLDKDISAMPMGMHTVISEGGGTFSGGQKQRLLISRALVTKPRIIFFDEATSALDNATQAIVTESLDRIAATRIVIAHRLSTIINADRIFVMERGRVIQEGTFEELVRRPGLFAQLVKRQMA